MAVSCKRFKKAIDKITKNGFYVDCVAVLIETELSNYHPYKKHLDKCETCQDLMETEFNRVYF